MDFGDRAQQLTEHHIETSLRNRKTLSIPFSGRCLSCEEPVEGDRRFCNTDCRDDWERERKKKFGISRPT